MMTRHGTKTEVDETVIDKALKDAGMLEANLPLEERRHMYQALQESKFKLVEDKTQRLSLSPQNNSEMNSQTCSLRDQESTSNERNRSQLTTADVTEVLTSDVSRHSFPGVKDEERRPGSNPSSLRKPAGSGRGRAVPTKSVKYPPLPISGPGMDRSRSSHVGSPQNRPSSPEIGLPEHANDASTNDTSSLQSQSSICSPVSPEKLERDSPVTSKPAPDSSDDSQEDDNVDVEDSEGNNSGSLQRASNQHQNISNTTEITADSPLSSSQDVEEEDEDSEKEPTHTMQIGHKSVPLSPFEFMVKPLPKESSLSGFDEIDNSKCDKAEWMKQAKALIARQKEAYWDKLLTEKWGPPIQDTGYNNRTLFKQVVPKYSKLFASTSEKSGASSVRTERQSKLQANARIQEVMADEGPDVEFHSLRRSKQKDVKREGNAWGIIRDDDDDVQCLEEPSEGEGSPIWDTSRGQGQERKIPVGNDPDFSPESPHAGGSQDPYDFVDEVWTPSNKNKKNNKRGGKSMQGDVEVEGRTSQRGRGSSAMTSGQRGRNTKLRLQNKSISHPSEHATSSNNPKNKGGPPEYCEEDTTARNNANSENRAWSNLNRGEAEVGSDISAKKFYNSRVSQPRNTLPAQPRRNSRENQRANDFPLSPGTSRQHDEVAVIETRPCPICGKSFPQKDIEVHADSCFEYGDESAVGEKPEVNSQNSEDSDRTVGKTEEDEDWLTPGKGEADDVVECMQCKESFTTADLKIHIKDCKNHTLSSSSGQKRASSLDSDDSGPAKKTSRIMN